MRSVGKTNSFGDQSPNSKEKRSHLPKKKKAKANNYFKCMLRDMCLCKMFQVKICFMHLHDIISKMEKHFDSVVVNGACEVQWVLLSYSCHHLQNLSATNTVWFRLYWLQVPMFACMKIYYASIVTVDSTHTMWHGSFLSFRQCPASHFFFVGNLVLIYWKPACVFFTPHHGASKKDTKL